MNPVAVLFVALAAASSPELLVAPPGCLDAAWTRMRFGRALEDAALERGGRAHPLDISLRALSRDGYLLLPTPPFSDPDAIDRFLQAAASAEPSVAELGVVRLWESPWELALAAPEDEPLLEDLVTGMPRGRSVRLRRESAGGVEVLSVVPEDHAGAFPYPADVSDWFRGPFVVDEVTLDGRAGRFFRLGKRLGARARMVAELTRLRGAAPDAPLVHMGGLGALHTGDRERCVADLRAFEVAAIAVGREELMLTTAELGDLSLPFVAANVVAVDGARPFPRSRVVTVDGRRVAVIAVMSPDDVYQLAPEHRARWRLEPPQASVEIALAELAARSPPVDVIVGVGAAANLLDDGQGEALGGLDVVIEPPVLADLSARAHVVEVDVATRALAVPPAPVLVERISSVGFGRLRLHLGEAGLNRVEFQTVPVTEEGPRAATPGVAADPLFAGRAQGDSLRLPDFDPLVRADPSLHALTFGDRVMHRGELHRFSPERSARVTDPVWMRLVTNAVRDELRVDVAMARNVMRRVDVTGPLSQGAVRGWLPEDEVVDVRVVSGRSLLAVGQAVAKAWRDPRTSPEDLVFAAGGDLGRGVIEGRPIDAEAPYRVAVTRAVAAMPELAPHLGPAPDTAPASLRALVLRRLDEVVPNPRAPDARDGLVRLLTDRTDEAVGHWQLRVDELGATGTLMMTAPGIERFARSRETRATTPNLVNVGLRLDAGLLYDGPTFTWENRVQSRYSNLIILRDGVPPQEQEDDVVVFTELRLRRWLHDVTGDAVALRPYTRLAFDSELTATPDFTVPGRTLPHQLLLRQELGLALFPTASWIEVARFGVVLQEDGSELTEGALELADIHYDIGLTAGLTWTVPIGPLAYRAVTEARAFAPDPDDRDLDLGLRLLSQHRLQAQLFGSVSGFLFVDVLALSTTKYDEASASVILGAGLQARTVERW